MAKLGLLFIAVFCIVQLTSAARVPRENTETTTESFSDKVAAGLNIAEQQLKSLFTKENADKAAQAISTGANSAYKSAQTAFDELTTGLKQFSDDLQKEQKKD
ncbi:uncharacterized protein LOC129568149 [Sitodiplosis mosellana]|uniref:uncharacterized protein LOC129568149 n=1 Tax=Sitodiplosis mosellana TaxID=263140 RepID=UPI002443B8B4|nr:uncharacterized protein LOC129568149 [Sitodiplosis mosellana]